MTDTIVTGAKVGSWTVVDVVGRAATCQCRCRTVRIVAVDALASGASTDCGCGPLSTEQVQLLRVSKEARQRARDLKNWRPRS